MISYSGINMGNTCKKGSRKTILTYRIRMDAKTNLEYSVVLEGTSTCYTDLMLGD